MNSTTKKFLSSFLYMIPFCESFVFSRYLLSDIPFLKVLLIPALPIFYIINYIPFGSLLIFLLLYFFVIRNIKVSYFIRFNSLQALLMNIALVIINFLFQLIANPFDNFLLTKTLSSTIFLGTLISVIFAIYKCLQEVEPELPGISNAVRLQL